MPSGLLEGASAVFSIEVLLLVTFGVLVGILFGASPGLTTSMGIALMLPITFGLPLVEGMALLLGLYIGGVSGGLITAILLNIPGTPASIATTFDGYPLARSGQPGKALGTGILFSFIGGIVSLIILVTVSPYLAKIAIKFGPVEYFAVSLFSLTLIAGLSGDSLRKGAVSALLGVLVTTVGAAPIDGVLRFTFGNHQLDGGLQLLPVLIGIYAITEVLKTAELKPDKLAEVVVGKLRGFGLSMKEFGSQTWNALRSSLIGTAIGVLPGLGAGVANIIAYSAARKQSKQPEKFGKGSLEGLVASESSNNAVSGGAMIPLLTMGIPGDAGTAILLAGLMIQGITPGPLMFSTSADIIYGIFIILLIANVVMIVMEFFGLRVFLKLLKIPKHILLPIIVVICTIGAFSTNNRMFDVWTILFFAAIGYALYKFKYPSAPFILGFILGPLLETNLRRGMMYTSGDFLPFLTRPASGLFMLLTVVSVAVIVWGKYKKRRQAPANRAG
ncbi:tripartite tricarboxylate transporter permease [Paenibacillus sp. IB182496]|uniref:Tripartite tricarboxylate transporter permease n=1 Tax=Paenibacillus sabuli TaxID=2772509 RepID=A0A927BVG7_9BACL|nr:tripartite tricarboxylate transporter permease [Paenibacillus sabuli]MBD2846651.1 tripartite tricarboxylate transporter permease [Paenibacillus sabuli]